MSRLTKEKLQEKLEDLGIQYSPEAKYDELLALLPDKPADEPQEPPTEETEPEEILPPEPPAETEEEARARLKAEARAEFEAEEAKKQQAVFDELDAQIKSMQKKKHLSAEEKQQLNALMVQRAKLNSTKRDLDALLPSQMERQEMMNYLDLKIVELKTENTPEAEHKIEVLTYDKSEPAALLRKRIKAFRNPAYEEQLIDYQQQRALGRRFLGGSRF